jgi:endonuclease III-like uncharacterized protein
MDKKLIDQYAFEIFSRAKIFESEFEVFKAQKWLDYISGETDDKSIILLHQSKLGSAKQKLENLKAQIEKFRQLKQINN